jgi:hypothetical protein
MRNGSAFMLIYQSIQRFTSKMRKIVVGLWRPCFGWREADRSVGCCHNNLASRFFIWDAVYRRFSDWAHKGIWYKMLYYFQEDADL